MSCCREEPHTNIVRAGQEGEKDSGKAQKQKGKEMRIIEAERRRDINREKGDSTMYSKKGCMCPKKENGTENEKGGKVQRSQRQTSKASSHLGVRNVV